MGARARGYRVPAPVPPDHQPARIGVSAEAHQTAAVSNQPLLLLSVAIAAGLTPLNSTMIAVALPAMAAEFGSPAASVTVLVITGYLIATVVCQMPAGSVADRVGYARALTLGRWIFAAGAVAAVAAPAL